eukprot:scaffold116722_cov75-Phaeocystis_antarctica.AAC.5
MGDIGVTAATQISSASHENNTAHRRYLHEPPHRLTQGDQLLHLRPPARRGRGHGCSLHGKPGLRRLCSPDKLRKMRLHELVGKWLKQYRQG